MRRIVHVPTPRRGVEYRRLTTPHRRESVLTGALTDVAAPAVPGSNRFQRWRRILAGLVLSLCLASCTGGLIRKDGEAVPFAEVRIWTCDSIGDFQTDADAGGAYAFNPFAPQSSEFDQSAFVPPGPVAIIVTSEEGSSVTRRDHQYDGTCQIPYNGATQDLPCKIQNIDLEPMQLNELFAAQNAFLQEDCGLAAEDADRLVTMSRSGPALGSIESFTGRPSAESCLNGCTESCLFEDVPFGDYATCMCICVEGQCDASFGPFCTESGMSPIPE